MPSASDCSVDSRSSACDPCCMERVRPRWLVLLAFFALAGCGSAGAASTADGSSGALARTPARRCAGPARLLAGVSFPAWHLGAVRFSSASIGIGITTSAIGCDYPLPTGGIEVGQQSQVTQLATTSDGGRAWQLTGAPVPASVTSGALSLEQLVATSSSDLWAVVGKGRLVTTSDGGASWTVQHLSGTVSQIEVAGGWVWALTCVGVRPYAFACRPQLWRTRTPGAGWSRVALPPRTAVDPQSVQLAVLPESLIVGVLGPGSESSFELLRSDDLGGRWARPAGELAWAALRQRIARQRPAHQRLAVVQHRGDRRQRQQRQDPAAHDRWRKDLAHRV